jgi:hypothetical protein
LQRGSGNATASPAAHTDRHRIKTDDRSRRVFNFQNQDELITAAARAEGKRSFVFYDSEAWHSWNQYLAGKALPPLQNTHTRQHVDKKGVLRVGLDMPDVFPPGYSRSWRR